MSINPTTNPNAAPAPSGRTGNENDNASYAKDLAREILWNGVNDGDDPVDILDAIGSVYDGDIDDLF